MVPNRVKEIDLIIMFKYKTALAVQDVLIQVSLAKRADTLMTYTLRRVGNKVKMRYYWTHGSEGYQMFWTSNLYFLFN